MFEVEGQFYAKVDYIPHESDDLLLHKKLGIENLDIEQREEELNKIEDIESLRTSIELYAIASPVTNFGKCHYENSMHLKLHIEDAEWNKLEEKFGTDDLEDIGWHLYRYNDFCQVQHITEEEYNNNVRK